MFGFIYPVERDRIPSGLSAMKRACRSPRAGQPRCQGTLLSRGQFVPDVDELGYEDARLSRGGT